MIKIATWNLLDTNDNAVAGLEYLITQGVNILCLQEISEKVKKDIENIHGYRYYFAKDTRSNDKICYLGILVKEGAEVFPKLEKKIRHKHGLSTASFFRQDLTESIESLSVVIAVKKRKFRIVNCHLPLRVPVAIRQIELQAVSQHFCGLPVILSGDFNSYAHPVINWTFGQLYGCRVSEVHMDELKLLEKFGRIHRLKLALKKVITFPYWILPQWRFLSFLRRMRLDGGHLDHIMISKELKILRSEVLNNRYGSDHHPVLAIIKISNSTYS